MSLALQQNDYFWADLLKQVDWYREHATPEIAERFVDAVQATLRGTADSWLTGFASAFDSVSVKI